MDAISPPLTGDRKLQLQKNGVIVGSFVRRDIGLEEAAIATSGGWIYRQSGTTRHRVAAEIDPTISPAPRVIES